MGDRDANEKHGVGGSPHASEAHSREPFWGVAIYSGNLSLGFSALVVLVTQGWCYMQGALGFGFTADSRLY